jgi:hypothetical protein
MLVAYDLVYVVMLILLRSLLEPVLILFALLANIGAFTTVCRLASATWVRRANMRPGAHVEHTLST